MCDFARYVNVWFANTISYKKKKSLAHVFASLLEVGKQTKKKMIQTPGCLLWSNLCPRVNAPLRASFQKKNSILSEWYHATRIWYIGWCKHLQKKRVVKLFLCCCLSLLTVGCLFTKKKKKYFKMASSQLIVLIIFCALKNIRLLIDVVYVVGVFLSFLFCCRHLQSKLRLGETKIDFFTGFSFMWRYNYQSLNVKVAN